MASISISGWSGSNGRTFTLTVTEQSYNPIANTSVVAWTLTASGDGQWYNSYLYASVNGSAVFNSYKAWGTGEFPAADGTRSGTISISHNADGTKTIPFYIEGYCFTNSWDTRSNSGTLALTNIDRTPATVTIGDPTNITTNSMDVTATASATCSEFAIRYKGTGDWSGWIYWAGSTSSHTFTLTGLAMNTNYTIQVAAKKASNEVYGYSGTVSAKTLGSSTITTTSDITLGNACSVTWTPLDSTYKFKLTFSLGTWSYTTGFISPAQLTAYTYTGYTIPVSVADELPNSVTGTMTAVLTTYTSDEVNIGTSNKTFTVTVPSNIVPTITSVTLEEGTHSGYNVYVKSLSTLKATVVASGNYSATITGIVVNVGGLSYVANSSGVATSEIFQTYGSMTVLTTVTDSRGRTSTNSQTITVYDYFRPTIAQSIDINGTTVATTVSGSIAPVNNLNAKSLVITRKRISDDTTTTYTVSPLTSYNYSVTWTQTVADIDTETYEYTAAVTDTKQTVSVTQITAIICLSRLRGGTGVTLFQEATQAGFWVRNVRHDITSAEYLALANDLAEDYDATADYYVGEFCINNSYVWECATAISGGENWNANHWTQLGAAV